MFQLIDRQTIRRPELRKGRLSDPDLLSKTQELFDKAAKPSEKSALSRLFSQVLHDIRMGGAWKRTDEGRLKQTEAMICKYLPGSPCNDVSVLDIGGSDGITTVELVAALEKYLGCRVKAYLSDLNLWLERYTLGPLAEYRAVNGEPVMARFRCVGLRLVEQRRGGQIGRDFLSRWYLRLGVLRRRLRLNQRIALVNPAVLTASNIVLHELNCLDFDHSLAGRFSVIRASNVLNLGYFRPEQIAHAVENLHAYLKNGGCLVVSRNADAEGTEIENGSVWLKEPDYMRRVDDFGSGSEVRGIVDSCRLSNGVR